MCSVKIPVVDKGNSTNLCLHRDFANQNLAYLEHVRIHTQPHANQGSSVDSDALIFKSPKIQVHTEGGSRELATVGSTGVALHVELVKERIASLLKDAKDQILATDDLLFSIHSNPSRYNRRYFNRNLNAMEKEGFIEIIKAADTSAMDDDSSKKLIRCARLIREYAVEKKLGEFTGFERSSTASQKYASKKQDDPEANLVIGEGGLLSDLSLEWQFFRLIYLSGSTGVTAQVLRRSLNNIGPKLTERILDRLLKGDGTSLKLSVTRVQENLGRERRYRYFASKNASTAFRSTPAGVQAPVRNVSKPLPIKMEVEEEQVAVNAPKEPKNAIAKQPIDAEAMDIEKSLPSTPAESVVFANLVGDLGSEKEPLDVEMVNHFLKSVHILQEDVKSPIIASPKPSAAEESPKKKGKICISVLMNARQIASTQTRDFYF